MPQTKRQIEAILAGLGARPNRRFGQNFLIDGNLLRKLVAAADVHDDDLAIEVGAGTGSLTEMLLDRARHVIAVEIDRALHGFLHDRLAGWRNLTLLGVDALANKHRLAPELVGAIREHRRATGATMLVANLPYPIASPLILDLLLSDLDVRRLCFTVQHEVAERITSPPGRKSYGPLGIVVQALCTTQIVAELPPSVFWPRPQVASTMLRLDRDDARAARIADLPHFVGVVRACFLHRRKTLAHAVAYLLGGKRADVPAWLDEFDPSRRPEQLAIDEWIRLAARLANAAVRP